MYTFFKTEERYAVERRKLPAFCRVKRPPRNRKDRRGIKKRLPRNKKEAGAEIPAGGPNTEFVFLVLPRLPLV